MAALDAPAVEPHPSQNVAAKSFGKSQALAARRREQRPDGSIRQPRKNLFDQRKALLDFADPHPDAGVDIACREYRNIKVELIVGGIAMRFAHIEIASAGPSHIAARAELACQLGGHDSRADGAVLQRSGFVVKFNEARKALVNFVQALPDAGCAGSIKIDGDTAGYDAIHHQPMTERDVRRTQHAFAQDT